MPSRPEDLRRTVADRVAQRVAGHGVSRATVDAAVMSVMSALEERTSAAPAPATSAMVVAAVTARSLPDLASRLRAALVKQGVTAGPIGIAAAGLHHVATLEIASAARPALEAAARALGAQVSIVAGDAR